MFSFVKVELSPFQYLTKLRDCRVEMMSVWVMLVMELSSFKEENVQIVRMRFLMLSL